ncbi:hypothetical protein IG631_13096 [Alternaria alternata]|nr:hypothetical protein IG631_13096 [Alternaria alternata]
MKQSRVLMQEARCGVRAICPTFASRGRRSALGCGDVRFPKCNLTGSFCVKIVETRA